MVVRPESQTAVALRRIDCSPLARYLRLCPVALVDEVVRGDLQ
jgi:hypothetical protein